MQRLGDDRGAVAVIVAMLMVPLIGFAAISLDVGAVWAKSQQLQTGADAGALAIAQDCAGNNCGTPAQTAQTFAVANMTANGNDGPPTAVVTTPGLTPTSGRVTVSNSAVRKHLFAPVLGIHQTTIVRTATAAWGNPGAGTAILPLAFSWCEFAAQTGGGLPSGSVERTIYFTKSSGVTSCTGPSNNVVPGGFGWLAVNSGTCNTTSAIGNILSTSTGASVPSGCTVAGLAATQGLVVLLPIFDQAGDTGSNSWYRVYGYAAFKLTGYYFGGQYVWNQGTCKGTDRCIHGFFTRFVDLSGSFTYSPSAPRLGAAAVSLIG